MLDYSINAHNPGFMDYNTYTLEQFVTDPLFRAWVLTPSDETEQFWQNYLVGHPHRKPLIMEARLVVRALVVQEISVPDTQQQLDKERLFEQLAPTYQVSIQRPLWQRYGIAASVALVLTMGGWLFWRQIATDPRTFTTTDERRTITLPDASEVTLQPHSRLVLAEGFTENAHRDIRLTGEAFFNVRKKSNKAHFLVHTTQLNVEVLGTSFTVRAYDSNKASSVVVRTGLVSVTPVHNPVSAQHRPQEVLLVPNDRLAYLGPTDQLVKTRLNDPTRILSLPQATNFAFDETPVPTAFATLEKAYGVDIVFDKAALAHCQLTADLNNETLYTKLDLICRTIRLSYQVIGDQIVITGKGCNL